MAGLRLQSRKKPRVTDSTWAFDEEQKQAAEEAQIQAEYANTPSLTGGAANDMSNSAGMAEGASGLMQGAGSFMSQPGMGGAVSGAANMVSGTMDPKQTGMGPALSGAASGAAMGTMVFPGIGTAVGAAVGLGLGLIKAKSNREQNKKAADAKAAEITAQGMQNSSKALLSAAQNRPNYSRARGLKL